VAFNNARKLGHFKNIKISDILVSYIDIKHLAMSLGALSGKSKRSKLPLLGEEGHFGNLR
jgi:hypothetical protein